MRSGAEEAAGPEARADEKGRTGEGRSSQPPVGRARGRAGACPGSRLGLVHVSLGGRRAEDRGPGPGPADHHRRGQRRPDEIALPPFTNLDVSRALPVHPGVDRQRADVAVQEPHVRPAAARAGEGRGGHRPRSATKRRRRSRSRWWPAACRPSEPRRQDPFASAFGDPFEEMLGRRPAGRWRRSSSCRLLPRGPGCGSASRSCSRTGSDTQTSVADLQFKRPRSSPASGRGPRAAAGLASGEAVTVEGETYRRFPILRKLLFPTKAGTLTLPAATFRIGLARQGFFDAGRVVERTTKPVTVTVDPLPDASGFSGRGSVPHVGEPRPGRRALGEAAMLRFRVEGTGNLKWDRPRPRGRREGARVFLRRRRATSRRRPTESAVRAPGVRGRAETSGAVEVPPLPFSWSTPRRAGS